MTSKSFRKRYILVYACAVILFIAIYYRLFNLHFLHCDDLLELAEKQHNLSIELFPKRGSIFDSQKKELALSLKVPSVYAVPRHIHEKEEIARLLTQILNVEYATVKSRLVRDKAFVWIKRNVSEEEARVITRLKNPNISIIYEHRRFYPHGTLLSHILGFCNIDNEGLEGLELRLNHYLKGESGFHYTKRDARGRKLVALEDKIIPPVDGYNVYLTIDHFIQYIVEQELDAAYTQWKAKSAVAIVMDCLSGRILAMANRPTFDLNKYYDSTEAVRRNRAVTDCFEPGSVFKIVTASAALQERTFTLDDTIFCERGEYTVWRGRVLHDVHGYGELTFPEVIIKSSNIGTVKIAQALGEETLYTYLKRFGFGEFTHIDLPGEIPGILRPVSQWSKSSITAIPMGQEVAVTALQMVNALAAIANGGKLMRPYVVDEIRDNKGICISKNHPLILQQCMDSDVAKTMRDILVRVVNEGTGKRAQIPGIQVGGKTGTAQKALKGGRGYSHSEFMSSFIGFVPADDPRLAIITVLDTPRPSYYGGTVSAPVVRNIAEKTLNYFGYVRGEHSDE